MTSNAGAREIISQGKIGFAGFGDKSSNSISYEQIKASAVVELKKIMSPELINRIDDIIVFGELSQEEIKSILDIQLKELSDRLLEKNIELTVKPAAKKYMVSHGYDAEMGARPMRRMIQRELEDPMSMIVLTRLPDSSNEIIVDSNGEKLSVKFKKQAKSSKKKLETSAEKVTRESI